MLAEHAEAVGTLLGQLREAVEDALGGDAHVERTRVDHALGDEAGVRVGVAADRVVAHVLDAARESDVVHAGADGCPHHRHARHRARAHAVDREAGHGLRQACEDRHRAAEREPLLAGLARRGDRDVVDAVGGNVGVSFHQADRRLDGEVIRSGVPVHALLAGAPERGSHAVDEVDVRELGHTASKVWD